MPDLSDERERAKVRAVAGSGPTKPEAAVGRAIGCGGAVPHKVSPVLLHFICAIHPEMQGSVKVQG
jgi:hypothetical protein